MILYGTHARKLRCEQPPPRRIFPWFFFGVLPQFSAVPFIIVDTSLFPPHQHCRSTFFLAALIPQRETTTRRTPSFLTFVHYCVRCASFNS